MIPLDEYKIKWKKLQIARSYIQNIYNKCRVITHDENYKVTMNEGDMEPYLNYNIHNLHVGVWKKKIKNKEWEMGEDNLHVIIF